MSSPLDPIIDQLADILKRTQEGLKNPPANKKVAPELWERVKYLEKLVMAYVQLNEAIRAQSRFEEKPAEKKIPAKDQAALDRLAKLKEEIIKQKEALEKETTKIKKLTPEGTKQREVTKRKKKFRGVGEQDKWKKL